MHNLWRRNLYGLWISQFLAMMAMSFFMPFIPLYVRVLGVSDLHEIERWSGILFSAPFLVSSIVTPIWGTMGDRYGRKLMVIRAIIGLSVSTTLMGFAHNVQQLLLLRILQGGISGFVSAALALMATSAPREKMGYALGLLQTSQTAGILVGPLIGGLMADHLGYRYIFFVTGAVIFMAGLTATIVVKETFVRGESKTKHSLWSNYRYVMSSPGLQMIFFTLLMRQFSVMIIEPIISLYVEALKKSADYLATVSGSIFAVTGLAQVVTAPFWGKRSDRKGYKNVLLISVIGAAISYIPQALVTEPYQLFFLRMALGVFTAGVLPSIYAFTSLLAPEEHRGGILGITQSAFLLGNVVGPVTGGMLAASIGMRAIFPITACLLLLTAYLIHKRVYEVMPESQINLNA